MSSNKDFSFFINEFVANDISAKRNTILFVVWNATHSFLAFTTQFFDKQVTIVTTQIVKYKREILWYLVIKIAFVVCCTSKFTRKVTMIFDFFCWIRYLVRILVVRISLCLQFSISFFKYHFFGKLEKVVVNFSYFLLKHDHKYLGYINFFTLSSEFNRTI